MTELELAYMAGFADGEGCFSVVKWSAGYSARFTVANTYLPTLEQFRKAFGGKIYLAHNHGKQGYDWILQGPLLPFCLQSLLPYLREKKPQAELLLEFYEKFGKQIGSRRRGKYEKIEQEWYYSRLRDLKQVQSEVEESSPIEVPATQLRLLA